MFLLYICHERINNIINNYRPQNDSPDVTPLLGGSSRALSEDLTIYHCEIHKNIIEI